MTAPAEARRVRVWDPLVRLSHWGIALAVVLNGLIVEDESLAHVWIGYAALGLLGLRLFWGFVGPAPARFASFPPSLSAGLAHARALASGRREAPHLSHNPLGALMAYALWGLLAIVSATGLMMESVAFYGVDWVEETHELAANAMLWLALLHVLGVAVETRRSKVDLVRAMISGDKTLPADDAPRGPA